MSATTEQRARLRRMVNEPSPEPYSDPVLDTYIERYPLLDERGELPWIWDATTQPPSKTDNPGWIPTYDLHAAAADIWEEKAAQVAADYDFSADGAQHSQSQVAARCMAQARYHRSRRSAKTMTLVQWPKETSIEDFPWILNLPESD